MLGESIQFIYFSGTGNTLLIVREMIDVFTDTGITVRPLKMEAISPETVNSTIPLGIAFPVAFQSTYPFVWKFINALPEVQGTPVFMVDTMMFFSGAIVGPLKKVLTRKGYRCIGAREIVMPNNWLRTKEISEKDELKIRKGKQEARSFAKSLITGSAKWGRIPFLSDGFKLLCCNAYVLDRFCFSISSRLSVDTKKCTGCGLCAKLCPVGNITLNDTPGFDSSCELCMRCLSFCPAHAISITGRQCVPYRAVSTKAISGSSIE